MQFAFGALLNHSLLKALAFQSNPILQGHHKKIRPRLSRGTEYLQTSKKTKNLLRRSNKILPYQF
jgi:hypothetical protein